MVSGFVRQVATDLFKVNKMKTNIHPQYREVAFTDMSIGKTFIIRSTADARETIEIDGVTYPQVGQAPIHPASLILSTPWCSDTYR